MKKYLVMREENGLTVYCLRRANSRDEAMVGLTKVVRVLELRI